MHGRGSLPPPEPPPYVFPHPPWTVGVVLVLGAVTLFLGVAGHWIWLLLGSPFVLTLFVWVVVRLTQWTRRWVATPERPPEER